MVVSLGAPASGEPVARPTPSPLPTAGAGLLTPSVAPSSLSIPPIPLVKKGERESLTGAAGGAGLVWSTTQERMDIATAALRLRDEQVSARVVYFEPESATNAELDKITEGVIAELKAMRNVREAQRPAAPQSHSDREIDLIAVLRQRLEQVLDPRGGSFLRAKLDVLSRRVTTLFFERALGHGASPEALAARPITLPEQGLYYAVVRSRQTLEADLKSLRYESPSVLERALENLASVERDLQLTYLSRKAPELEQLLPLVLSVFGEFFRETFRRNVGDFCWQVVRASKVARLPIEPGKAIYKISPAGFAKFRETFERLFLEQLLLGVKEPLIAQIEAHQGRFAPGTLAFVADPQVFSAVCAVMCDAFYDHLHSEGVLELPVGWRVREPG